MSINNDVKVLIAGDFCPPNELSVSYMNQLIVVLDEADYKIVNFECSLCKGHENAIPKEGPALKCDEEQFSQLAHIGADLLTLANNHILDYGMEGLKNVIDSARNKHIDIVGAGTLTDDVNPIFYFEKKGIKFSVVNCCEHEFSVADRNRGGANPLNPVAQYYQIKKARKNSDVVITIVHGGHEYYQLPSPRMQDSYRFFIDVGADVVVGHHAHCFSGMEKYHGGHIFYGLGNFLFHDNSKRRWMWNNGFSLLLSVNKENGISLSYSLMPHKQCVNGINFELLNEDEYEAFIKEFNHLSSVISNREQLEREYAMYEEKEQRKALSRVLPFSNHYLVALYKRGLLPSMLSYETIISRLNAVQCESHRDLLIAALRTKLRK